MKRIMRERFDIVVIGNSAAGLQAIRTIRRHSNRLSVAIIDRENCPAYSRVLTPYYVGGKIDRQHLFIVDQSFYESIGVTTLFGQSAVALDAERRVAGLSDGTEVEYGKLLLAVGAEARMIEVKADAVGVLRHMDDAEHLTQLLKRARSVTAIGAGLVSIPFLSHAGPEMERHLIIGSDRVLSRVLDAEASALLEERFKAEGLILHKKDDVTALNSKNRLELTLASGKRLTTDMLVVGKGVTPNTKLAHNAGLAVNDGILIDEYCRTDRPDIFAAGDAAEGRDFITGETTVQGNWITAVEQGENAALNMLGHNCAYEGSLKNNIAELFGTDLAAVGYCRDDAPRTESFCDSFTGRFRKVFLDEQERVIGATMIGETNDAGVYFNMVKTRTKFPGKRLLSGGNRYADVMQLQA